MKDQLIIIGASGHGKVVADIAIQMDKWQDIYFLDDNENVKECVDLEVIGNITEAARYKEAADFFVAIGNNKTREKIQDELIYKGLSVAKLIHPSSVIGRDVEIGIGTVVMAGVVINSSSRIGKGCIINTSSSIDHDNVIGDYSHISPGVNLAGTVAVGKRSWLGIGSTVSNNVNICNDCKVGAGGVVIRDINEPGTYVGLPVRRVVG